MSTIAAYQSLAADARKTSGEFLHTLQASLHKRPADGSWQELVDGAWNSFVASLPEELRAAGQALPMTLRLTPRPLPWSQIFPQPFRLALPIFLADALPDATPESTRRAMLAHLLGIVAACAAERIDDGRISVTATLLKLLIHLRKAREEAIASFRTSGVGPAYDYRAAERATTEAKRVERSFLCSTDRADFSAYECLSINKQWLAFPAIMTYGRACGLDGTGLSHLANLSLALAMGFQLREDAARWEEDEGRGRSWAVLLLRHAEGGAAVFDAEDSQSLRERMADAGIIVSMLHGAARHFLRAASAARELGAHAVAAWADKQARRTHELAHAELQHPGHFTRST